ncbi:MAG: sulfur carrier protein ThiS [Acidobacteriales bacterium]|nr:sulfur carrier protein ThiS [Terriglobales bacterium]
MEVQSKSVEVTVNGERKQVPSGLSVAALLDSLKVASDRVAVELDRSIVRKRDWCETFVQNGSKIEIVEFVGGG